MIYREISKQDMLQISNIHIKSLPDDFLSLLGVQFLNKHYYPYLIDSASCTKCAVENNQIIGFVVFVTNNNFLHSFVRSNKFIILYYVFQKVYRLKFLFYMVNVFRILFRNIEMDGDELAYIAVDRNYQGMGIGKTLVQDCIGELKKSGKKSLWVKTLSATPENIKFYKVQGFTVKNEVLGRVYLEYNLTVNLDDVSESDVQKP